MIDLEVKRLIISILDNLEMEGKKTIENMLYDDRLWEKHGMDGIKGYNADSSNIIPQWLIVKKYLNYWCFSVIFSIHNVS